MTEEATTDWTQWMLLDDVAPLMAIGTEQSYDELADTLCHLQELKLMQFGQDEAGTLLFRVRCDEEALAAAWLDDHLQARAT